MSIARYDLRYPPAFWAWITQRHRVHPVHRNPYASARARAHNNNVFAVGRRNARGRVNRCGVTRGADVRVLYVRRAPRAVLYLYGAAAGRWDSRCRRISFERRSPWNRREGKVPERIHYSALGQMTNFVTEIEDKDNGSSETKIKDNLLVIQTKKKKKKRG